MRALSKHRAQIIGLEPCVRVDELVVRRQIIVEIGNGYLATLWVIRRSPEEAQRSLGIAAEGDAQRQTPTSRGCQQGRVDRDALPRLREFAAHERLADRR